MSVRKSITLLTLLLSVSAAPFIAADVAGGFVARAALPSTICDLSNVRAAVANANALVDKGDLAAARTRLKDLDKFWDVAADRHAMARHRQGDRPRARSRSPGSSTTLAQCGQGRQSARGSRRRRRSGARKKSSGRRWKTLMTDVCTLCGHPTTTIVVLG